MTQNHLLCRRIRQRVTRFVLVTRRALWYRRAVRALLPDNLPEHLKAGLPDALRFNALHAAMQAHVHSQIIRGSELDLACRLRLRQQLAADKRPTSKLSFGEQCVRKAQRKTVKELDRMIRYAISKNDHEFLRRLADGSARANEEISQKVRGAKAAAVLAIAHLWETLGRKPGRHEIIDFKNCQLRRWRIRQRDRSPRANSI